MECLKERMCYGECFREKRVSWVNARKEEKTTAKHRGGNRSMPAFEHALKPIALVHALEPIAFEHALEPIAFEHARKPIAFVGARKPIAFEHAPEHIAFEHARKPIAFCGRTQTYSLYIAHIRGL